MVAGAFLNAGATDLHCGMIWPWKPSGRQRTEIDVVCNWQETILAISVKAYALKTGKKKDQIRSEIKAMAMEGFGRYAIPILVHLPSRDEGAWISCIADMKGDGVLEIGGWQLSDAWRLGDLLSRVIKGVSTS